MAAGGLDAGAAKGNVCGEYEPEAVRWERPLGERVRRQMEVGEAGRGRESDVDYGGRVAGRRVGSSGQGIQGVPGD